MARLNHFSTMVVFFIATITVMVPSSTPVHAYRHLSQLNISPSPDEIYADEISQDQIYVEKLPKGFKSFVEECAKKMTIPCSEEIVISMLNNTHVSVSIKCCHKLVDMGLKCHNGLVKLFAGLPGAKGYESLIVSNGAALYNKCALVARKLSPAPSQSLY